MNTTNDQANNTDMTQAEVDSMLALLMGEQKPKEQGTIIATTRQVRPHYYRCTQCLTVFTIDSKLPPSTQKYKRIEALCGCGAEHHSIEYLGQSTVDRRLTNSEDLCPCDSRCTNATGPNCNCKCGGYNHGSQRIVTVSYDNGKVPTVTLQNPEQARKIRQEYIDAIKAAYQRIRSRYGAENVEAKARGEWINRGAWEGIHYGNLEILAAQKKKIHKARMTALAAVCA